MKRELTRDLLMIFTDKVWVRFKRGEQFERVYGQWCLMCKWVRNSEPLLIILIWRDHSAETIKCSLTRRACVVYSSLGPTRAVKCIFIIIMMSTRSSVKLTTYQWTTGAFSETSGRRCRPSQGDCRLRPLWTVLFKCRKDQKSSQEMPCYMSWHSLLRATTRWVSEVGYQSQQKITHVHHRHLH